MVCTPDTMVLYSPNVVLTSGLMVCTLDTMVHYSPNLVLTIGLMVCTVDTMVLYSSNVVLPRVLMVCRLDIMVFYSPTLLFTSGLMVCTLHTMVHDSGCGSPPLQSGGQNQKWPTCGQGGYFTRAVSGIPTASEQGQNQKWPTCGQSGYVTAAVSGIPIASERRAKSELAHLWARWLRHPCRLGDPHLVVLPTKLCKDLLGLKHQRVDAIVTKEKAERPYGTPCHSPNLVLRVARWSPPDPEVSPCPREPCGCPSLQRRQGP